MAIKTVPPWNYSESRGGERRFNFRMKDWRFGLQRIHCEVETIVIDTVLVLTILLFILLLITVFCHNRRSVNCLDVERSLEAHNLELFGTLLTQNPVTKGQRHI